MVSQSRRRPRSDHVPRAESDHRRQAGGQMLERPDHEGMLVFPGGLRQVDLLQLGNYFQSASLDGPGNFNVADFDPVSVHRDFSIYLRQHCLFPWDIMLRARLDIDVTEKHKAFRLNSFSERNPDFLPLRRPILSDTLSPNEKRIAGDPDPDRRLRPPGGPDVPAGGRPADPRP